MSVGPQAAASRTRRAKAFRSTGILAAMLFFSPHLASAQSPSAFPYGGQLVLDQQRVDTGGVPGDYDFQFRAFDSADPETSRQIGPTLERPGLPLSDGRFNTRLDFGAEALQGRQLWVETLVTHRGPDGPRVVAQSRQQVSLRGGAPQVSSPTPPVTNDREILERLAGVRVVISDRQSPGNPHFLIDNESFRRAFGVAEPVTATDTAAVGLVAASQLKRELDASRQRTLELEAEIGRLRFRINATLLLLAAVVASVFLQRRRDVPAASSAASTSESSRAPETAEDPES
ncbi:MAG: hypothetical protein AAGM22_32740 [Acidobacteriota bacterium]